MITSSRLPCVALFFALAPATAAMAQEATRLVSIAWDGAGGEASGDTLPGTFSADGRHVAWSSSCDNFVPHDIYAGYDVFYRDRATGVTQLVSVDSSGLQGQGDSVDAVISDDGRFIAFASQAPLVGSDDNHEWDIYLHDRITGQTSCVSVNPSGSPGAYRSLAPTISGDGRYVAFFSSSDDLVPGDTNQLFDVFVRDVVLGQTTRVSVSSTGEQANQENGNSSISVDGRYVAFDSYASNLVANDSNGLRDVFVRDLTLSTTTRVSVRSDGSQALGGHSGTPGYARGRWLANDGRVVTFLSEATNLVDGDTNACADAFVHDLSTGATTRVSVGPHGEQGDRETLYSILSADGGHVLFTSDARNFGSPSGSSVYLHDRATGDTTLVSVDDAGERAFGSWGTWLSPDLRHIGLRIFEDVSSEDVNNRYDVYVRGPDIELTADPLVVTAGQTLMLSVHNGKPGKLASLWAVDVNGIPVFLLLAAGVFNPNRVFALVATVPPGLSGVDVTFRGIAIGVFSKVVVTNDAAVHFQ